MPTHRTTASVLRLRASAEITSTIIGRLPQHTELLLIEGPLNGWVRVRATLSDGMLLGWVSEEHIAPITIAPPVEEPEWLTIARGEIGVREYPGHEDNPRILQYARATTLGAADDETPWCSAFVNWCMQQAGILGTRSAAARSWANWGTALPAPRPGSVVVFRRNDPNNPNAGHVAFFIARRGNFIDVLGGNQSNSVRIATYTANDLIGYRWRA